MNRRTFLKVAGLVAAGLSVAVPELVTADKLAAPSINSLREGLVGAWVFHEGQVSDLSLIEHKGDVHWYRYNGTGWVLAPRDLT